MKKFNFVFLFLLLSIMLVGSVNATSTCGLVDEWEVTHLSCDDSVLIGTDVSVSQCNALCEGIDTTCCWWVKANPYNRCYSGSSIATASANSYDHAVPCITEGSTTIIDTLPETISSSDSLITKNSVKLTGVFKYNSYPIISSYFKLNNVSQVKTDWVETTETTETFNYDVGGLSSTTTYNYTFCIDGRNNNDLVSYWSFDDGIGNDDVDDNDLNVTSATFELGKINYGLTFEEDDNATSSEDFDFIQNTGEFSLSLWLKLSSVTTGTSEIIMTTTTSSSSGKGFLLSYDSIGTKRDLKFFATKGVLGEYGKSIILNNAITDTNWHHIVINGDSEMFIDGDKKAPTITDNGFSVGDSNFGLTIGGSVGGFDYTIDELGIYSRVLSDNYVTSLYNNGTGETGFSDVTICDDTNNFITNEQVGVDFVYTPDSNSIDNMFDALDTDENWAKLIGGFLIVLATILISVVSFGSAKVEYGAFGFLIFSLIGVIIATSFGLFPAYILVIFLIIGLLAIIMNKVFGGND